MPQGVQGQESEDHAQDMTEYVIRRYAMTYPDRCRAKARTRYIASAEILGEEEGNFVRFAAKLSKEGRTEIALAEPSQSSADTISSVESENAVISRKPVRTRTTDHVRLSYIDHTRVFQLLQHLLRNVVHLGSSRHRYLQTVGIPQGSVMSTLLCDVYFGHMERELVQCGKLPLRKEDLAPELHLRWNNCEEANPMALMPMMVQRRKTHESHQHSAG